VLSDATFRCPYADLLRPLDDVQLAALRDSIAAGGVRDHVLLDLEMNVLDGLARLGVAADLGLGLDDVPVLFVEDLARPPHLDCAVGAVTADPPDGALVEIVDLPPLVPADVARAVVLEANLPERRLAGATNAAAQAARHLLRLARRCRVAAAKRAGCSLAVIAKRERVSVAQIRRDLAAAPRAVLALRRPARPRPGDQAAAAG